MVTLNLTANGTEQTAIKEFLQNNASEVLAEKINNGVRIFKDGIPLISKKNLDSFMKYACDEAKKLAEKGANSACVHSDTVFNWAIHYFEEDSIEGVLYNDDDTEFKPPKPKYEPKTTTSVTPPASKPKPQMSLFDFMEQNEKENEAEVKNKTVEPAETDEDDDYLSEEEQREILREIAEEDARQQEKDESVDLGTGEILTEEEMRKFNGDIEEPKELLATSSIEKPAATVTNTIYDNKVFNKLSELLGNILIAR